MLKKALVIGLIQFATLWAGNVFAGRVTIVIIPGSTPVTTAPVTVSGSLAGVCRSSSVSAC